MHFPSESVAESLIIGEFMTQQLEGDSFTRWGLGKVNNSHASCSNARSKSITSDELRIARFEIVHVPSI
jgi:hypothetical protein